MSSNTYEGKQDEIRDLKIEPEIEVFHNVYTDGSFTFEHIQPEFTSVCPKTGLPDYGTITVSCVPNNLCIELKSFKLYLNGYRNIGIFMENSPNKIARDIVDKIQPKWLRVVGIFKPRGGIATRCGVEYQEGVGFIAVDMFEV